jgi:hypothetical protein
VCAVSRAYRRIHGEGYWYAFHPHQKEKLSAAREGYVAYGCGSEKAVLLIPFRDFGAWLDGLNTTQLQDRFYWHVHIDRDGGKYFLRRKKGFEKVDVTKYLVE